MIELRGRKLVISTLLLTVLVNEVTAASLSRVSAAGAVAAEQRVVAASVLRDRLVEKKSTAELLNGSRLFLSVKACLDNLTTLVEQREGSYDRLSQTFEEWKKEVDYRDVRRVAAHEGLKRRLEEIATKGRQMEGVTIVFMVLFVFIFGIGLTALQRMAYSVDVARRDNDRIRRSYLLRDIDRHTSDTRI